MIRTWLAPFWIAKSININLTWWNSSSVKNDFIRLSAETGRKKYPAAALVGLWRDQVRGELGKLQESKKEAEVINVEDGDFSGDVF